MTVATESKRIGPQAGPQEMCLITPADIAIFGGAAGGGKTWALLLEVLRHASNPEFGAVIFRRTYTQITNEGGMWDESEKLYPHAGALPRRQQGSLERHHRTDRSGEVSGRAVKGARGAARVAGVLVTHREVSDHRTGFLR